MNSNILKLDQVQRMSIDEVVNMYRHGYRLEEIYPKIDDIVPYSKRGYPYQFMNPAICPTSPITKGTTKDIKLEVTSPGTPPYTFKVQRDDTEILTYTGGATETSKIWPHNFDEIPGTYNFNAFIKDSCPTGSKTSNIDSCSITVQEAPVTPPAGAGVSPLIILLGLGLLGYVVMAK